MCCTLVPLIIGGNEGKESIHLSGRPLLAVLQDQKREQGMKATIERATLLKSLSHVQSVVERRNTIPILSNVLIEAASDGGIRLMATDLDLQIVDTVQAAVDTPGATTVSAHTLFDIVRKLPEGSQVSLSAAEGKMQVNAGRARFSLQALPRDDFPVIAEGDLPVSFELPAATLIQIIDKTRFAIRSEEHKSELQSLMRISYAVFCLKNKINSLNTICYNLFRLLNNKILRKLP